MKKQLEAIVLIVVLLVAIGAFYFIYKQGGIKTGQATYAECVANCQNQYKNADPKLKADLISLCIQAHCQQQSPQQPLQGGGTTAGGPGVIVGGGGTTAGGPGTIVISDGSGTIAGSGGAATPPPCSLVCTNCDVLDAKNCKCLPPAKVPCGTGFLIDSIRGLLSTGTCGYDAMPTCIDGKLGPPKCDKAVCGLNNKKTCETIADHKRGVCKDCNCIPSEAPVSEVSSSTYVELCRKCSEDPTFLEKCFSFLGKAADVYGYAGSPFPTFDKDGKCDGISWTWTIKLGKK